MIHAEMSSGVTSFQGLVTEVFIRANSKYFTLAAVPSPCKKLNVTAVVHISFAARTLSLVCHYRAAMAKHIQLTITSALGALKSAL